jgi:hypothetical protein
MPDVRHELLTTLKGELVPLGVLDEFKSAGVFVNWWQQIRYDLKTIISISWHHSFAAYLCALRAPVHANICDIYWILSRPLFDSDRNQVIPRSVL